MRLFLAHSPADVNNYLSICRPVPLSARRSTRDACVWVPCVKPLARSHGLCKFTMEYKPIISNLLKLFWPQIFVNRAQRRRRRACMCHSYIRPDDAHQLLHCMRQLLRTVRCRCARDSSFMYCICTRQTERVRSGKEREDWCVHI